MVVELLGYWPVGLCILGVSLLIVALLGWVAGSGSEGRAAGPTGRCRECGAVLGYTGICPTCDIRLMTAQWEREDRERGVNR